MNACPKSADSNDVTEASLDAPRTQGGGSVRKDYVNYISKTFISLIWRDRIANLAVIAII